MNISDKTLELTCIAAAIWNKEALYKIIELDRDDFFYNEIKIMFDVLKDLTEKNINIDLNVFRLKLIEEENYMCCGGDEIISLIAKMYNVINLDYIIKTLKIFSKKRKILVMADEIKENALSPFFQPDEIFNKIYETEKLIENIKINEYKNFFINNSLDDLLRNNNYIPTQLQSIDKKVFGIFDSELIIIASRPSVGKSSLALQIALNISKDLHGLFFSLEMPEKQLLIKMIANYSLINSNLIRINKIDLFDRKKLEDSYKELSKLNLTIIDNVFNLDKIIYICHKISRFKKISFIIIDYLQLIQVSGKEQRYIQIGKISRSLKQLSRTFDIPVIALSQINRIDEGDVPKLHHLRESGDLEQDADMVMFLYDSHALERSEKVEQHEIDIIFAKNRMGRIGTGKLFYQKQYSKIIDIDENLNNIQWEKNK